MEGLEHGWHDLLHLCEDFLAGSHCVSVYVKGCMTVGKEVFSVYIKRNRILIEVEYEHTMIICRVELSIINLCI